MSERWRYAFMGAFVAGVSATLQHADHWSWAVARGVSTLVLWGIGEVACFLWRHLRWEW